MVGQYFDKKRGKAFALATSANGIGALTLSPLIQFMAYEYSYTGTFIVLGACTLHFCVSGALFRPLEDPVSRQRNLSQSNNNYVDIDHIIFEGEKASSKMLESDENIEPEPKCKTCLDSIEDGLGLSLLAKGRFLAHCIILFFMYMTFDICITFMTASVRESGFTDRQVTVLLLCINAVDIPVRLITGIIFDLPPIRRKRRLAFTILILIKSTIVVTIPLISGVVDSVVIWTLYTSFRAATQCQIASVTAHTVGQDNITAGIGLARFFQGMGMLVGTSAGGKYSYGETIYFQRVSD